MSKVYVQYGCGLSAPEEWVNFDVSPTLRLQKLPLIGSIFKRRNTVFPANVRYGDVVKGLPLSADSCDGLYCSHVLEHLSLQDFRKALTDSYRVLKAGGTFRCIVPDLESYAREYVRDLDAGETEASHQFMNQTLLGEQHRAKGLKGLLKTIWGNSAHLWMWDAQSLAQELEKAGFKQVRRCEFNDAADPMFKLVEEKSRFDRAVALECIK